MKEDISFYKVSSNDNELKKLISNWYFKEWNIPHAYSLKRLENIPNNDVTFQLVLLYKNTPIATGGLYNKVGLLDSNPKFSIYYPWLALLYTEERFRNLGFGTMLLNKLELLSQELGYKEIFLHTFSAEKLYLRNNWFQIDEAPYKNHNTIVMKKIL